MIDIFQVMIISLFPTPFDHFHPALELKGSYQGLYWEPVLWNPESLSLKNFFFSKSPHFDLVNHTFFIIFKDIVGHRLYFWKPGSSMILDTHRISFNDFQSRWGCLLGRQWVATDGWEGFSLAIGLVFSLLILLLLLLLFLLLLLSYF